jgi:hypothetical protein
MLHLTCYINRIVYFIKESEDTTVVLTFLWSMINGEERSVQFLQKCREGSKMLPMGGESVTAAVIAVFCALVWHTQQLREDLEKYGKIFLSLL